MLALASLCALGLLPLTASANVGELDRSFGVGGRVETSAELSGETRLAVGADASTLVSKGLVLFRFKPNGKVDGRFGRKGKRVLPGSVEGLDLETYPMFTALDHAGRALIYLTATDSARRFSVPNTLLTTPASWAVVFRLTPTGKLDRSFGGGKGFTRTDFGLRSEFDTDVPLVRLVGGRVDSQGRPVLLLSTSGLSGNCNYGHSAIVWRPRAVARLTEGGAIDSSFGGGAGAAVIEGGEGAMPNMDLDAMDAIVVASDTEACQTVGDRVYRFDASGSPVSGFGTDGARYYPGLIWAALDPSGGLIFSGSRGGSYALFKTDPSGNLESSFAEEGAATVRMPVGSGRRLHVVAVDDKRRIVLVGSLERSSYTRYTGGPGKGGQGRRAKRSFVAVTRVLSSGRIDRRVGKEGWLVTPVSRSKGARVQQAGLTLRWRLVVDVSRPTRKRALLLRFFLGS